MSTALTTAPASVWVAPIAFGSHGDLRQSIGIFWTCCDNSRHHACLTYQRERPNGRTEAPPMMVARLVKPGYVLNIAHVLGRYKRSPPVHCWATHHSPETGRNGCADRQPDPRTGKLSELGRRHVKSGSTGFINPPPSSSALEREWFLFPGIPSPHCQRPAASLGAIS